MGRTSGQRRGQASRGRPNPALEQLRAASQAKAAKAQATVICISDSSDEDKDLRTPNHKTSTAQQHTLNRAHVSKTIADDPVAGQRHTLNHAHVSKTISGQRHDPLTRQPVRSKVKACHDVELEMSKENLPIQGLDSHGTTNHITDRARSSDRTIADEARGFQELLDYLRSPHGITTWPLDRLGQACQWARALDMRSTNQGYQRSLYKTLLQNPYIPSALLAALFESASRLPSGQDHFQKVIVALSEKNMRINTCTV